MASRNKAAAKAAICPFYVRADGQRRIACEGTEDGNRLCVYFLESAAFQRHMSARCCHDYKKCPIYIGLQETKYKEI